jgi:hypothetical protein
MFACVNFAAAQEQNESGEMQKQQRPIMVAPEAQRPMTATSKRNLYCAGFIQHAPAPNFLEIAGGEQEQEQVVYGEGDFVYLNAGANQGVKVGYEYTVARPRGQFKSKFSKKNGYLGAYFQEIGAVRVIVVKENVSVAEVVAACDTIVLGDLLRAFEGRNAPEQPQMVPFDRFTDPTNKANGRIVLARDGLELLARDQIVFVDLGTEDGVKAGDSMTIYRKVGKGNTTRFRDDNVSTSSSYGFESDVFKGGPFSTKSPRTKSTGDQGVYGPTTSIPDVKRRRPQMPRKIVGELIILSVQQRTATAVITRVTQEVHTGDYVEVK